VKRTPPSLVDLGRTLGLAERAILVRIVVPHAAPSIWDSLRISLGWAWTWVVLAELSGASSGLGYRINEAQHFFESDTVIGYLLLLGLLAGGAVDRRNVLGLGCAGRRLARAGCGARVIFAGGGGVADVRDDLPDRQRVALGGNPLQRSVLV